MLIDALALLQREGAVALLIGADAGRQGYRDELLKRVQRRGLEGAVRFVGHCNDMPAAYMLADVVVSASTQPEAFGRTAAEAQAMGRPVIATDHGGARETVLPGKTGWLTPPGDAGALAQALDAALSMSAPERQRMARTAVTNIRRNFSKQAMTDRTLALYAELVQERERQERGRGGIAAIMPSAQGGTAMLSTARTVYGVYAKLKDGRRHPGSPSSAISAKIRSASGDEYPVAAGILLHPHPQLRKGGSQRPFARHSSLPAKSSWWTRNPRTARPPSRKRRELGSSNRPGWAAVARSASAKTMPATGCSTSMPDLLEVAPARHRRTGTGGDTEFVSERRA